MKDLKKCPFCGSSNVYLNGDRVCYGMGENIAEWKVKCKVCFARGSMFSEYNLSTEKCKEKAIEAWNSRAIEAEIRNKAIDEFAAYMKQSFVFDSLARDDVSCSYYRKTIDEIAEQMKGEKE